MDRDEFELLSAGHALGALSAADDRAFTEALAAHPEWEASVLADLATVASLADSIAEETPPPDTRALLMALIGADQVTPATRAQARQARADAAAATEEPDASASPSTEAVQTATRRRWTQGVFALAASFAVLAAVGFGSAWLGGQLFPHPPEQIALEQIQRSADAQSAAVDVAGGGEATAYWSGALGQAVLVADGVAPLDPDQTYEMWFVRDDGAIAAGTFDVSATGEATAVLQGGIQSGDYIALTVEPQGGSPTGEPSSDPVAVIETI